ncbi:Abi family protein [Magnetococcales bacterium HHB-1]
MTKPFDKPFLTINQQIKLLISRGMQIDDRDEVVNLLSTVSYYRLSAYWHPFWIRDAEGNTTDRYEPDSALSTVIALYVFDRQLRLLVLDAIERIEIAIRGSIAARLAQQYGAFSHTDAGTFQPRFQHTAWLERIKQETRRSKERFIRHYKQTYQEFPSLPIWIATEIMSLGTISRLYLGMKPTDRKAVSHQFNIHHQRFGSHLHTLTYIRNVCAHHSRLWNRPFAVSQHVSRHPHWQPPLTPRHDRIFYALLILRQLLAEMKTGEGWQEQCSKLIRPIAANPRWRMSMGMPENWQEHPLWVRSIGVAAEP